MREIRGQKSEVSKTPALSAMLFPLGTVGTLLMAPSVLTLKSAIRNSQSAILVCALLFALGSVTEAQQTRKVARIGFLVPGSKAMFSTRVDTFRHGLADFGYVEGHNVIIEYRYGDNVDRLPDLAAELVRLKVDVIVTAGTGTRAAKQATSTIPIVFAAATDPVGTGLIDSLARPGGNITGLTNLSEDLDGKRLEVLKESFPKINRVANFWYTTSPRSEMQAVAQALGLQIQTVEVRSANDFGSAFEVVLKQDAQALSMSPSPVFITHHKPIIDFAARNRLPMIYPNRSFVDAGGLMSYGGGDSGFRRAAYFVDKILKGAKPADLPVEQPTKFELAINLKTAKQIRVTIPQSVLYRADKVIK